MLKAEMFLQIIPIFSSLFSHILFAGPSFLPFCFISLYCNLFYYFSFLKLYSSHLLKPYSTFTFLSVRMHSAVSTENPIQMGLNNKETLLIHVIEKPRNRAGLGCGLKIHDVVGLQFHCSPVFLALLSFVCGLNSFSSSQIYIRMPHHESLSWSQRSQKE